VIHDTFPHDGRTLPRGALVEIEAVLVLDA